MALSPISNISAAPSASEVQKPVAAPAPTQSDPATLKPDTATISAAGHVASSAGDTDRDGDAH